MSELYRKYCCHQHKVGEKIGQTNFERKSINCHVGNYAKNI